MIKSDFQFSNPYLTNLVFIVNEEFEPNNSEEVNISNEINVSVQRPQTGNEAIVSLLIEINKDISNRPFYLKIEIEAVFSWNNSMAEDMIDTMLSKNAPALLLAYARPIVANITNSSPFPTYNLPFMNFLASSES
ncbi:protein-export chaperone SecB [Syntrophomonas wolfei]|uniref:protein-export chaperone SecB n=1 Tax=Syntrophomonas wolfei TaxID=863 RepID=UPI0023EF99C2|nr:protein-export chaperone SecB [Syntrophomonas wolfei]